MVALGSGTSEAADLAYLHKWVVGWVIKRMRARGVPLWRIGDLDDVTQVGWVAMMKAARKFDPGKGGFAGYARRAVERDLHRAVLESGLVAVPCHLSEPGCDSRPEYIKAASRARKVRSIDARIRRYNPDDHATVAHSLADSRPPVPDQAALAEMVEALRQAIESLRPNQRQAILLVDLGGMTCAEVARQSGVTTAAVSKSVHAGRESLRKALLCRSGLWQ